MISKCILIRIWRISKTRKPFTLTAHRGSQIKSFSWCWNYACNDQWICWEKLASLWIHWRRKVIWTWHLIVQNFHNANWWPSQSLKMINRQKFANNLFPAIFHWECKLIFRIVMWLLHCSMKMIFDKFFERWGKRWFSNIGRVWMIHWKFSKYSINWSI